jgi:quinol monooxygenase YgiN
MLASVRSRPQEGKMYGTIARMKLKPGSEQKMVALMREEEEARIPGDRGVIVYRSDRDPTEFFLAVRFENKEAYRANADSPEMHKRYLAYRELLEVEPEWHDGEIVHSSV